MAFTSSGKNSTSRNEDDSTTTEENDCDLWFDIFMNDNDNDDLIYWEEVNVLSTNPIAIDNPTPDCPEGDTDNDGLPNWYERKYCTQTPVGIRWMDLNADFDGDGLTVQEEAENYGTDPLNPDTDDDEINDNEELNVYGTNPLNPDTDFDGLYDKEETEIYKTSPLDSDTDNDGVNDKNDINPLIDTVISVKIKRIKAIDPVDQFDEAEFYMHVYIGNDYSDNSWVKSSYPMADNDNDISPNWVVSYNVDDRSTCCAVFLYLLEKDMPWNDDDVCDISPKSGGGDENHPSTSICTLYYDLRTGTWGGPYSDDYIGDATGYGHVRGDEDGSTGSDEDDCKIWFDVYQNDNDNDGLMYWEEVNTYGTDPTSSDTDGDRLLDGNIFEGTQDADGDGLINAKDTDSDNDGLLDGFELGVTEYNSIDSSLKIEPSDKSRIRGDEDNDRVLDDGETWGDLNPLDEDTDGDHIPDGWIDGWGMKSDGSWGVINDPDNQPQLWEGEAISYNKGSVGSCLFKYLSPDNPSWLSRLTRFIIVRWATSNDFDNDGLPDGVERWNLLNPNKADTDGDGLLDGAEYFGWDTEDYPPEVANAHIDKVVPNPIHYITDPSKSDTDEDGMDDKEELINGGNPLYWGDGDLDEDGLRNGLEVTGWDVYIYYESNGTYDGNNLLKKHVSSDPNDPDSDGDGLSDLEEYNLCSDPRNSDTDEDYLLDDVDPVICGKENMAPHFDWETWATDWTGVSATLHMKLKNCYDNVGIKKLYIKIKSSTGSWEWWSMTWDPYTTATVEMEKTWTVWAVNSYDITWEVTDANGNVAKDTTHISSAFEVIEDLAKSGFENLAQKWEESKEAAENALKEATKAIVENTMKYVVDPMIQTYYSTSVSVLGTWGENLGNEEGHGGQFDWGWLRASSLFEKLIFEKDRYLGNLCNRVELGGWWSEHYYINPFVPVYWQIGYDGACAALSSLEIVHYFGDTSYTIEDLNAWDDAGDASNGMSWDETQKFLQDTMHWELTKSFDGGDTISFSEVRTEIYDESDPILGHYRNYYGKNARHAVVIVGYTDTWLGKYVYIIDTNYPFISPYPLPWDSASDGYEPHHMHFTTG